MKGKVAKRSSAPGLEKDFAEVVEFLKSEGILPQRPTSQQLAVAKKLHAASYSLILWRFRIGRLPEHRRVFLHEIASDALQILPQALMGYGKTTVLLIRSVIENLGRHIYFSDHPIEFQRANMERKWYMAIGEYFDYLKNHPAFLQTERNFDAINRLKSLYDELSAEIHGRKVVHLEMRRALRDIAFDQALFDKQVRFLKRCAEASNFLLLVFHHDRVTSFPQESKQIILRTIPPEARRVWRGLE